MSICNEIIKRRIIRFRRGNQQDIAERAAELLSAVEGVARARVRDTHSLLIHYDVRVLTLQMIENALDDVGFKLSGNLVCIIRREMIAYCEDNLRDTLQIEEADKHSENDRPVEQSAHDPRPYNWRNYT